MDTDEEVAIVLTDPSGDDPGTVRHTGAGDYPDQSASDLDDRDSASPDPESVPMETLKAAPFLAAVADDSGNTPARKRHTKAQNPMPSLTVRPSTTNRVPAFRYDKKVR